MTHREQSEQLASQLMEIEEPMLVEVEYALRIEAVLHERWQRGVEAAANVVISYNFDHDHGRKATDACDELVDLLHALAAKAKEVA